MQLMKLNETNGEHSDEKWLEVDRIASPAMNFATLNHTYRLHGYNQRSTWQPTSPA